MFAAKNSDTGPGCGLGTLHGQITNIQNIAPQVMMATTNGTLFKTVGISFALSGYTNNGNRDGRTQGRDVCRSKSSKTSLRIGRGGRANIFVIVTMKGRPHSGSAGVLFWHRTDIES